jgi:FOG: Glucan-binding domain (YG repeat)
MEVLLMKKNILVAGLVAMLSVASVVPVFAEGGAVSFGGSSVTAPESNGHWVTNRDGSWSFISNETGAPLTGWIVSKHQWYYIAANGHMVGGWQKINFAWYYFSPNTVENQPTGSLYINKMTPDGYQVDSNGIWVN